jgi:protein-S-isoprenylcysteine O-methyltransferase Ste14
MTYLYRYLFPALWLTWVAYWWLAARNVKPTVRQEGEGSRALHVVPLALAAALLFLPRSPIAILGERFVPYVAWTFWVGAALTLGGLLFSVWARVHLGRNWSAYVTVKEGHELVTDGPYRYVRHPIYTGLLLGFIGSALARGEWRGIVAVALAVFALWRKSRLEEQWMRERFGTVYEDYARRVAALIPYLL